MGNHFMGHATLMTVLLVSGVAGCSEDDGGGSDAGTSTGGSYGAGGYAAGGTAGGNAAGGTAGGTSGDEACCTLQQCGQDANGSPAQWQECQAEYCDPNAADGCDELISACLERNCSLTSPDPATCNQVGAQCNQDFNCCEGTEYCDLNNGACAPIADCSRQGSQCESDADCCPQPAAPGYSEYCENGSCTVVDSQ